MAFICHEGNSGLFRCISSIMSGPYSVDLHRRHPHGNDPRFPGDIVLLSRADRMFPRRKLQKSTFTLLLTTPKEHCLVDRAKLYVQILSVVEFLY